MKNDIKQCWPLFLTLVCFVVAYLFVGVSIVDLIAGTTDSATKPSLESTCHSIGGQVYTQELTDMKIWSCVKYYKVIK